MRKERGDCSLLRMRLSKAKSDTWAESAENASKPSELRA